MKNLTVLNNRMTFIILYILGKRVNLNSFFKRVAVVPSTLATVPIKESIGRLKRVIKIVEFIVYIKITSKKNQVLRYFSAIFLGSVTRSLVTV